MEPITFTKQDAIARYLEFAVAPPEATRGSLRVQISVCKTLYLKFGYQPALQMLSQIASVDVSRTKGRSRDQEAAAKLLKRFLNAVKVDKSGIQ